MHSRETKYLNSLLVDKEIEDDGSVIKNVVVRKDFEDGQHLGGWGGATFDVVSESLMDLNVGRLQMTLNLLFMQSSLLLICHLKQGKYII